MRLLLSLSIGCFLASCATGHMRIAKPLVLISNGNRQASGDALAAAFNVPVTCNTTTFDVIERHTDHEGCFWCLSFDVIPEDQCQYKVKAVYLTVSDHDRDKARTTLWNYLTPILPPGKPAAVQELPTGSAESSIENVVIPAGPGRVFELDVQVSRVGGVWVASAVVFDH